jgi:hypothetical protein
MLGSTRVDGPVALMAAVVVLHLFGCAETPVAPVERSQLSVSVAVSGLDTHDAFLVTFDGGAPHAFSAAVGLAFGSVASGEHTLALSGFPANCSVAGPNPLVVTLAPSEVAEVDFRITCTATNGAIAVAAMVSGSSQPIWFSLQVDAAPYQTLRANQRTLAGTYAIGAHIVRLLNVPSFCDVIGDDTTTVSIGTGGLRRDTVLVSFDVNCHPVQYASGDSAVIAFQRGREIAVLREDGSNAQILTQGTAPSWSPDGEFLVFQRPMSCVPDLGCSTSLWMIRPDRSGAREITNTTGVDDSDPVVSPDGRRVSFIRFWQGPDQSYLMLGDLIGTPPMVLSIWHPYSKPTWSPDGTQIAFTCQGPPSTWELDICRVSTAGGCASYLVNVCTDVPPVEHLTSTRFFESEPAWSPDGARIAFTLACSDAACPPGIATRESYIALLNPITGLVTPVVPGHRPAWSPDGTRIVFVGNSGNPGLSVINWDGTGLRRLTDDSSDTAPSWR